MFCTGPEAANEQLIQIQPGQHAPHLDVSWRIKELITED
jgi:hypothetical protein